MKKWLILFFLLFLPPFARCSVLSDAANALGVGQWTTITSTDLNTTFFNTSGASGYIITYDPGGLMWNHRAGTQGRLYFKGANHTGSMCCPNRLVQYDVATNTWSVLWQGTTQEVPLAADDEDFQHSYGHQSIDEFNGFVYSYWVNQRKLRRWSITGGSWAFTTATNNLYGSTGIAGGLAWFPELEGLVWYHATDNPGYGSLTLYKPATNTWSRLDTQGQLPDDPSQGSYHGLAKYNPIHKLVWFGGGNSNPNMWIVRMDSTISSPTAVSPFPMGSGPTQSKIIVDGVTGDYLVYFFSGNFYKYDPIANTWTLLSAPPLATGASFDRVTGCGIPQLGVTVWVDCSSDPCVMKMYKHAAAPSTFTTRAAMPGVIRADSFDDPNDLYYSRGSIGTLPNCDADSFLVNHPNGNNPFSTFAGSARTSAGNTVAAQLSGGRCNYPTIDTVTKHFGAGSLKFTIPTQSPDNTSGSYIEAFQRVTEHGQVIDSCIGPAANGCTLGTTFWFQFKQRVDTPFLTTAYLCTDGAGGSAPCGGWKQVIWTGNDLPGGTGWTGVVSVVENNGGTAANGQLTGVPQIYGHELSIGSGGATNNYNYQAVRGCVSGQGSSTYPEPPCYRYRANTWQEYTGMVKLANACGANNSTVRLWVDGELVVNTTTAQGLSSCSQVGGFGQFEVTPFHTNKDATQSHSQGTTWVDSLLISTNPIPMSLFTGTAATQAPAAPTGFRIRNPPAQ